MLIIFVIWKLREGQLIGVGDGPSCETWSAARHSPPGPSPVRSYDNPWGLQGLRSKQWRQVRIGTVLLQFLVELLWEAALRGLCGFIEHPQFPTWLMKERPASIWSLTAIRALSKLLCVYSTFQPGSPRPYYCCACRSFRTWLCSEVLMEDAIILAATNHCMESKPMAHSVLPGRRFTRRH